jgi:hypothetical protein
LSGINKLKKLGKLLKQCMCFMNCSPFKKFVLLRVRRVSGPRGRRTLKSTEGVGFSNF